MAEYGLIDGSGNVLPVRDDIAGGDQDEPEEKQPETPAGPGLFRVEVPLSGGRKAVLALPDDVTGPDVAKICAVLTAYTA